jgi:hypothetical protein
MRDKIYLLNGKSRKGPYIIISIITGKYTLSLENGKEISINYLEAA